MEQAVHSRHFIARNPCDSPGPKRRVLVMIAGIGHGPEVGRKKVEKQDKPRLKGWVGVGGE